MGGMAGWKGSEDAESLASLQRAVDLGCNFFDTAWAYGDGHSEELLGKVLRANADKRLYTATKVPPKNRRWPARREYFVGGLFPPSDSGEGVGQDLGELGGEGSGFGCASDVE